VSTCHTVTGSGHFYRAIRWKRKKKRNLSRQIYAVPDLCCVVSRRSVESVGGVFDPVVSLAIAVFEHVKDELAVIPCLLLATL